MQQPERNYYRDIDSMWIDMANECLLHGIRLDSREGDCFESIGWSGTLQAGASTILRNERRALSAAYAGAEMLWYTSETGDIEMIKAYAPQYPRWANEGVMLGAVGRRMAGTDPRLIKGSQFDTAVRLLRQSPETRQCVMSMWEQVDLETAEQGTCNNVPCYLAFQAFIRDGHMGPQLNWVTNMRSNDVWLGAPYDIFAFSMLQRTMASELDVNVGTYTHNVGSLHVYAKNVQPARDAVEEHEAQLKANTYVYSKPTVPSIPRDRGGMAAWSEANKCESIVRNLCAQNKPEDAILVVKCVVDKLGQSYVADCLISSAYSLLWPLMDTPFTLGKFNNPLFAINAGRDMARSNAKGKSC